MTGEVDTCRSRLAPFCVGDGLDIGFGGCQPIVPGAICIDRPVGHIGRRQGPVEYPNHLTGDVADLFWFDGGTLDFCFSSHVLEDFTDTADVMAEWLRVLRVGGNLVLFLPDQKAYAACCLGLGTTPNEAHIYPDFGLDFVKNLLGELSGYGPQIIHELFPVPGNPYSFDLVIKRTL